MLWTKKIVNLNQTDKGQGHIIPDFEEVLKKGYQNIKKELEENLKKILKWLFQSFLDSIKCDYRTY